MKTAKLAFLSILISASLALPVFAATGPRSAMDKLAEDQAQEALDAVSGPAFGISADQARAAGAVSVDAEAAESTAADGSEAASAGVAPGQAPVTGERVPISDSSRPPATIIPTAAPVRTAAGPALSIPSPQTGPCFPREPGSVSATATSSIRSKIPVSTAIWWTSTMRPTPKL